MNVCNRVNNVSVPYSGNSEFRSVSRGLSFYLWVSLVPPLLSIYLVGYLKIDHNRLLPNLFFHQNSWPHNRPNLILLWVQTSTSN